MLDVLVAAGLAAGQLVHQIQATEGTPTGSESTITSFVDTEGVALPEILIDEAQLATLSENGTSKDEGTIDLLHDFLPLRKRDVNLDVPFFPQVTDGNRVLPRKESCEEASITLSAHYFKGGVLTEEQFKKDVLRVIDLENERFGQYIDTNVAQTAYLYETIFGGTVKIVDNPTVRDLKSYLKKGYPIIAPFAGQELANSNFTSGGPRYHMMILRGYDQTYFYTNEVGSVYGNNFPYSHEVIMEAIHDFVPYEVGPITNGAKRVLVVTS